MEDRQQIDQLSPTWRLIKKRCEAEIASSRATLEATGVSERDSDFARGRISAMREILNLPSPTAAEIYRQQAVEQE